MRLPFVCIAICGAILAASADPALAVEARQPVLGIAGLGAIKLGSTIPVVERRLGAKLAPLWGNPPKGKPGDGCWLWGRRDGKDKRLNYMTERGKLVRIDLDESVGPSPRILTARGIGIGSTIAEVKAAYGDVRFEPQPSNPPLQWAVVERNGKDGIGVETNDGRVVAMFVGRGAALDYPEGCA
jgi:hypothetical protein